MKRLEEPRMRNRKRKQESDHFLAVGRILSEFFDLCSQAYDLSPRRLSAANLRGAKPAATPELS